MINVWACEVGARCERTSEGDTRPTVYLAKERAARVRESERAARVRESELASARRSQLKYPPNRAIAQLARIIPCDVVRVIIGYLVRLALAPLRRRIDGRRGLVRSVEQIERHCRKDADRHKERPQVERVFRGLAALVEARRGRQERVPDDRSLGLLAAPAGGRRVDQRSSTGRRRQRCRRRHSRASRHKRGHRPFNSN